MKFNRFTKTIAFISFALFITASFSSCMDPIFHNIREEVKLEDMTIHGEIYSFARIGSGDAEEIFFSNGKIYHKAASHTGHGGWKEFSSPDGRVITIASDSKDNLYAVTVYFSKDDSDGEMKVSSKSLYTCNVSDGKWKLLKQSIGKNTVCALMGTNSTTQNNRAAFVNIGGTGYKLENGEIFDHVAANNKKSCASLNGTVKFYTDYAACSNAADTAVYYSDGISVKVQDDKSDRTISSGVRSTVYGLAVMADSVLVNTSSGAALIDKDSGKEISFANLTSTLSTLYEGRAVIVADPKENHDSSIVYAGLTIKGTGSNSALFTHEGLWSYYPSRGKWNVE